MIATGRAMWMSAAHSRHAAWKATGESAESTTAAHADKGNTTRECHCQLAYPVCEVFVAAREGAASCIRQFDGMYQARAQTKNRTEKVRSFTE